MTPDEIRIRYCEYFDRVYLSIREWNGHKARCPVHGTSAALKEGIR